MKFDLRAHNRSLIVLLLPLVALMLISCKSVEEGSWVTIDNIEHRDDTSVYYVTEKKSPFGINEKVEDSQGHRRVCHLIEFIPNPTTSPDIEQGYSALPFNDREWHLCRELKLTDKPSFDPTSLPPEVKKEFGVE